MDKMVISLRGMSVLREQGNSSFELKIPEFSVSPGNFIAVTGESGCGKSTLLDLLALVLRPAIEGEFLFQTESRFATDINALWQYHGEDRLAEIRRSQLGYVPQSGGLLPFLSLRRNVYLPPRLNQQHGFQKRIDHLSEQLGIDTLLDRMPHSLSGGQRQRAAILRAMAHQPDLILADEPTAAVDSVRARRIMAQFHELAQLQNTAIVMVTHDESLVAENCDARYGFVVDSSNEENVVSVCRKVA